MIIGIYFDDLLVVAGSQKEINLLKKALTIRFKITNLRLVTYYLALHIIKDLDAGTMVFTQEIYVQKILSCFGMQNAKRVDIDGIWIWFYDLL